MTELIIELPADVYEYLATTARQQHKPVDVLAREWLTERHALTLHGSQRERTRTALRDAGLLVERPADAYRQKPLTAAQRADLAAKIPPGRSLADIIIAEREQN